MNALTHLTREGKPVTGCFAKDDHGSDNLDDVTCLLCLQRITAQSLVVLLQHLGAAPKPHKGWSPPGGRSL